MKKHTAIFLLIYCFSSSLRSNAQTQPLPNQADATIQNITKDFATWWNYHYYKIRLDSDFRAIDESSKEISKPAFLEQLISGNFIAVKLKDDEAIYYKLVKLKRKDTSISRAIGGDASTALSHYKKEGTSFPNFNFADLEGTTFNNENTTGKTTIFKCWYIGCTACVAEFPELNELVDKYKSDSTIQFVSLAFDNAEKLTAFLTKRPFAYKVVPNQQEFMADSLQVSAYPTHYVVDENGIIKKMFNKANDLIAYLEKTHRQ